ncbi:TRAP transporter substrate-binding protein DctP [uncultured Desulfosarcina sp.]|uniref:TRAP transporter substrate-binding protein DctP n=1 Tax=uncultured Desulfosarcina sp. TaxID=218289 RepID=UPI0029C85DC7|nr:TRAP transporter substrate-binding protein DctP [uncultured Desulfosarcina sp.]
MRFVCGTLFIGLMSFFFGVFTPTTSQAAKYVLKIGHSNPEQPYSNVSAPWAVFAQEVEKRTGGDVQVKIYANGVLGNQKAMWEQASMGVIQATIMSAGNIAPYYPNIAAISIPYLFLHHDVAWEVFDGPVGDWLRKDMVEKTGMRPLAWCEDAGYRNFTNSKREVRTPADLKGLKIRTMPVPAHMKLVEVTGAKPTPIAWSELYSALQTKVVDGEENPISTIKLARLYEVQKYLTLDGHLYGAISIYLNDKWFQELPKEYQAAIIKAGEIAKVAARGICRINESIDLEFLKSKGMEVYAPTTEEKRMFQDATQKEVITYLKSQMDPKIIDMVLDETDKAERKLGYK